MHKNHVIKVRTDEKGHHNPTLEKAERDSGQCTWGGETGPCCKCE